MTTRGLHFSLVMLGTDWQMIVSLLLLLLPPLLPFVVPGAGLLGQTVLYWTEVGERQWMER